MKKENIIYTIQKLQNEIDYYKFHANNLIFILFSADAMLIAFFIGYAAYVKDLDLPLVVIIYSVAIILLFFVGIFLIFYFGLKGYLKKTEGLYHLIKQLYKKLLDYNKK